MISSLCVNFATFLRRPFLRSAGILIAAGLWLAGCSYSPPKWVNPATWFDGKSEQVEAEKETETKTPESESEQAPRKVEAVKPPAEGLLKDSKNATYSDGNLKARPSSQVDAPQKPAPVEPKPQPSEDKQSAVPAKPEKTAESLAATSSPEKPGESKSPVASSEPARPTETVAERETETATDSENKPDPLQIVQRSPADIQALQQAGASPSVNAEPGRLPEVKSIVQGRAPIAPARSSDPVRPQLASAENPAPPAATPASAASPTQPQLRLVVDSSPEVKEEEQPPHLVLSAMEVSEAPAWPVVLRFEKGKRLADGEAAQLKTLAEQLQQMEGTIHIAGHASGSARGREEADRMLSNFTLSLGRAEAIARHLEQYGISGDRMVLEGYGDRSPAVPHDSPVAEVINRRVEIYLR